METITEQEIETLKGVIAQACPNEWTDFPGNGRSQRTHIGYLIETTIGEAQIPLFETNTNAKRADVLLAIYSRNYLPSLITEVENLRADLSTARTNTAAALDTLADMTAENARLTAEVEAAFSLLSCVPTDDTFSNVYMVGFDEALTTYHQARAARLTRADGDGGVS